MSLQTSLVSCVLIALLAPTHGREYVVLGLFPLSGGEEARGNAQLAGVRVAWEEEVALLNVVSDVRVIFMYNDTKVRI